jgi:orotate phosphoribosyltransferase
VTELREKLIEIVLERGLARFDEPVALASGQLSREFIDGKAALARGEDLEVACRAMIEALEGVAFDAIGGLTMGADQFAHVVAVLAGKEWFVVRKTPKGRGTNKLVEGAKLGPGRRVVVVEDVVTTGGSMLKACDEVSALGAEVVRALSLIDRGDAARRIFEERSIPYDAVVTYRDLGIAPVGDGHVPERVG